ncbi:protein NEDD1 [Selaginella moellendorffii]|uniref:protein NEDD1 n=1 Tax=Selaginella moellendorffii TaxID=88036 RepID=UPI000D1C739B|nr:protein NEDD1 [Selaginella moellendorffii]|eukprot:XP_024538354.1 protein NEDD1 [Selaginella moellendorffii]
MKIREAAMQQRLIAACGGDNVKLFDAAAASEGRADPCVSQFLPAPGVQVNALRWNHTNHVLASSGEDRRISLWLKGGKLLGSVPQLESDPADVLDESILAINFSSKSSRYLCSGGTGKVVRIWDMQRKKCIKSLKGHADTITGVMYNCKDEHLASISSRGDLIIYSLASGSRITEVKDPFNQVLRLLEYSRSSRNLLVTAGDDGSLHLWDTTGRSPKASWIRQHLAPASGVGFSFSNEKVIVSVGFDKRLHTYDTSVKKAVHSLSCDAPFSSLALKDDGWTVAAGTTNGRIMFYDIRTKVQPMAVLRAFNPSEAVASVCWQRTNPVPISTSSWSPDVALLGANGEETPAIMPDPLPASGRNRPSFGRPESLTVANPRNAAAAEESSNQSVWSNSGSFILHSSKATPSGVDDMEVFSPLVDVQPIVQPLSSFIDGLGETKRPSPPSAIANSDEFQQTSHQDEHPTTSPRVEASNAAEPSPNDHQTRLTKAREHLAAVKGLALELPPRLSASSPNSPPSRVSPPQPSSSSFALQLVQRALEESLGSVQRAIHEDVQNLHLELIRQFHIQQTETACCVEKLVSKQAEMMEELQALRKENQQLRHLI